MPHRFLALAICILLWGLAPLASANLLSNWSFEENGYADWQQPDGIPGWTFWEDYPYDGDGAANGAPWAVHAGALTTVTGGAEDPFPHGNNCLAIGAEYGTWRAFMYQEVSVIPGRWYSLEGCGATGGQGGPGGATCWVVDGPWQGVEAPGEGRNGGDNGPVAGEMVFEWIQDYYDNDWHRFVETWPYEAYFKATSDTLTVACEGWADVDGAYRTACFDALVMELTDIPEPGTLALLATGLAAAAGRSVRSRRR